MGLLGRKPAADTNINRNTDTNTDANMNTNINRNTDTNTDANMNTNTDANMNTNINRNTDTNTDANSVAWMHGCKYGKKINLYTNKHCTNTNV